MRKGFFIFSFLLFITGFAFTQNTRLDTSSVNDWQSIRLPNILPVHPLVNYSARKLINPKVKPDRFSYSINLSNGNVWLPKTDTYYPIHQSDIDSINQIVWHERKLEYTDIDTEKEQLYIDGLFRSINFEFSHGLNAKHEIAINIRTLYMEKGKRPFTYFNSDDFIEKFHSNIYGGEDPFARKIYGFDKSILYYQQTNGKVLTYSGRHFFIPGIEISHYFYPGNKLFDNDKLFFNIGQHIGINTTKFNTSLDYCISITGMRQSNLKKFRQFNIALGSSIFYHQLLKSKKASHFYDQSINLMAEGNVEYKWMGKKVKNYKSLILDFYFQSAYDRGHNNKDYKGAIIYGDPNFSLGHVTSTHMFTSTQTWSLIYSQYFGNIVISFYLQEDLKLNNTPDTQTGIAVKYYLK